MFRDAFQNKFFTVFNSCGRNPLSHWTAQVRNGQCKRITDADLNTLVLELSSVNSTTTFITAPPDPRQSLAVKLPFVTLIVKNSHKYFGFEIQIRDDENQLRRYQASNFQSKTRANIFCIQMPLRLADGWNQVQINLDEFTKRAFNTNYLETVRIRVNANCRLRRIYFTDRLYGDHEKPQEYRLAVRQTVPEKSPVCGVPPSTPIQVEPENCCEQFRCNADCSRNL